MRSTSSQGLSAIQVVFGRNSDPYLQRQVITERLADASALLPAGVSPPQLSPLSSSMEYLLHFGFTSERLSPLELRDLVRWTIKPQILAVPGVAQAQIFGGDMRERQLWIDPAKLDAAGLTLEDVFEAARRGTQMTGGGLPRDTDPAHRAAGAGAGGHARGAATDRDRHAARACRCASRMSPRCRTARRRASAMRSSTGARESWSKPPRSTAPIRSRSRGISNTVCDVLAPALAQRGVQYHPALLRPASFIESAIAKLRNSLLIGALLVVVLLLVTLRDWRGALISFSAIPVSLLATVWILSAWGLSLNTMSLGGLVVALGVVVDDAVIDVENITRRRRAAPAGTRMRDATPQCLPRGAPPGVLRHRGRRGRLPADPDALGPAGRLLPAAATSFLLAVGAVAAGRDERNAGAVRVAHAGLRAARGSRAGLRRCKSWQQRAIGRLAPHAKLVLAFCS